MSDGIDYKELNTSQLFKPQDQHFDGFSQWAHCQRMS